MIFKYNSCLAFVNIEQDEDTDEKYLNLHNIESKIPGQYDGTITLLQVIDYARKNHMSIRCHPWSLYGDHARLKAWYEKLGFTNSGDWFVYTVI